MTTEFDKNLNISYYDENLPKPNNLLILKHFYCSVLLYLFIYFFLAHNPFFKNFFIKELQIIYQIGLYIYFVTAPIIYLIFKPKSIYKSHSIEIFNYIGKVIKNIFCKKKEKFPTYKDIIESFTPTYDEKQALMLIFIKVFFGTLMSKFLCDNYFTIIHNLDFCNKIFENVNTQSLIPVILKYKEFFYRFCITILFTIDILMFAIGYLTETVFLKNKIRTVDTNIVGVLVCLICYPPFNYISSCFLGWNQNDNVYARWDETGAITWTLRLIGIFFLIIYTLASCALGTKASNLTNRGTVTRFPYSIVRHPAYISKNLFWLCTTIPLLIVDFKSPNFEIFEYLIWAGLVLCSYIFWLGIYYFRAIYEERHLMQDPDYQEYTQKVKYRFIPFVV